MTHFPIQFQAQDLDIIRLMEDNTREVKEEDEATQIKNAASVIETSAASLHRYRLSTMLNASSMAVSTII